MIKGMLKTGLFLLVVAALSGSLLAYSESLTAPVIKANQEKAEKLAQKEVLPSEYFVKASKTINENEIEYALGFDNNKSLTGAVFKVAPKGFGGPISIMVGIRKDGRIYGYQILSISETPGLGSKLNTEEFNKKFINLLSINPHPTLKVKKDGGDVDAVTAATISSRAFCAGLQEAKDMFFAIKDDINNAKYEDYVEGGKAND